MSHSIRPTILLLSVALTAACGEEPEKTKATTQVIEEPLPKEAVSEVKLQKEAYRSYYYCDKDYAQVCDDLPQAYVLDRETGEPYRIVFYDNQDKHSTLVYYHYVSVDMTTKTITEMGHFAWQVIAGVTKKEGKPLWGIPE